MQGMRIATMGLVLLVPMAAIAGRGPAVPGGVAAARPGSAWGTANSENLKAMARPADLAAPANTSPGLGHIEAAAIARLMDGKVIDLKREGSAAGGSGGGGPQ